MTSVAASQNKVNELLEAIRQEFANVSQEANTYRLQNQKDYDFKIKQHLAEMQQVRNTVYELELTHRKMKDAYEEEINRLKLELEQKDRQLASLAHGTGMGGAQSTGIPQIGRLSGGQGSQAPPNAVPAPTIPQPVVSQAGGNTMAPIGPQHAAVPGGASAGSGVLNVQPSAQAHPVVQISNGGDQNVLVPTGQAQVQQSLAPGQASLASESQAVQQQPTQPSQVPQPQQQTQQPATTVANVSNAAVPTAASTTSDQTSQDHYVVPANQKAVHAKPIPPFLLDLDSQLVPSHLKKQTNEYYVLYNPALPIELDVDLHISLDHSSVVCCVRFSSDGEYLATGCNKTTQVYKVSTGELVARLSDDSVTSAQIQPVSGEQSSNGPTTTGENGANGSTQSAQNSTSAASSDLYIRSVCFSPDGKFLATGAEDKLIRIWDLETKKIVMTLKGHEQDIYSLDYFPSGNKLVSGSGDRTVRIWDLTTGSCSLTLSIEDGVTTVAVSPGEGKFIAAGSLDRTVRVWDSDTGFLVERLDSENELGTGHRDSVYSVVFTRDGNGVVSGSLDRSVKLWNLNDFSGQKRHAECEVTYTGHKDFVLSVATTQNDEYILSGSKDRGVLFWDTKSGNPLLMLQGHRNSVISVTVANGHPLGPDYGVFATGSGDCKARIWKYSKKVQQQNPTQVKELKE